MVDFLRNRWFTWVMTTAIRHPWSFHRRSAGYTQDSLADLLGVTRHYIIRLEQGLFTRPQRLAELSEVFKVSEGELQLEYLGYVRATRVAFAEEHLSFKSLKGYNGPEHPLIAYREAENLSRIGLCKGLCLHQDSINDYEKNRQRGVPLQLIEACSDINWDYAYLDEAVVNWRQSGRADAERIRAAHSSGN